MKELVGQRAISAFNILMEGTQTTTELTAALKDSGGAAQEMADIQLDNLQGQMTLLNSATEGLGIALFGLVEGALSNMVTGLTGLTSAMTTLVKFGFEGFREATSDTSDELSQMLIKTNDTKASFNQLTGSLLNLVKQEELSAGQIKLRNQYVNELIEAHPQYFKGLKIEEETYSSLSRKINDARVQLDLLSEQQIEMATAQVFQKEIAETNAKIVLLEGFLAKATSMGDLFVRNNKSGAAAAKELREEIESLEAQLTIITDSYKNASQNSLMLGDSIKEGVIAESANLEIRKQNLEISNEIAPVTAQITEGYQNQKLATDSAAYSFTDLKNNMDQAAASAIFAAGSITSTSDAMGAAKQAAQQAAAAFIQAEIQKAVSSFISSQIASAGALGFLVAPLALAGGAAFGSLMGSAVQRIQFAEAGYSGVVDKPTMFMTGENNKAEQVSITPLESPNIAGGAAGGGITVNVSAPLVDETVLDSILPAIERAQQMELA